MKTKILYVDDEHFNLLAFKASFRRDFQVFTTTNAEEARKILQENEIEVIVSDQKMPEETGIEFFESIKDIYYSPCRLLLTGYVESDILMNAVKKGEIYFYITKPWMENEVRFLIEKSVTVRKYRNLFKDYIINFISENKDGDVPTLLTTSNGQVLAKNLSADDLLGGQLITKARQNIGNFMQESELTFPLTEKAMALVLDPKKQIEVVASSKVVAELEDEKLIQWEFCVEHASA